MSRLTRIFSNLNTLVPGLWSASFYLGSFLGPTLGGILVEQSGFANACLLAFLANCLMVFVDAGEARSFRKKTNVIKQTKIKLERIS